MRALRPEQAETILAILAQKRNIASSNEPDTTGGVCCLHRNCECVPLRVGTTSMIVEFTIPYYLTQVEFYESILLRTRSGGYFVPKLEHRYLNISYIADDYQIITLCETPPDKLPSDQNALADAVRTALLRYYRAYPNANQFFYIADTRISGLLHTIFHDIPAELLARYSFEHYTDLANPYAGFSLTSKAL